jgi:hypothetical protein
MNSNLPAVRLAGTTDATDSGIGGMTAFA